MSTFVVSRDDALESKPIEAKGEHGIFPDPRGQSRGHDGSEGQFCGCTTCI